MHTRLRMREEDSFCSTRQIFLSFTAGVAVAAAGCSETGCEAVACAIIIAAANINNITLSWELRSATKPRNFNGSTTIRSDFNAIGLAQPMRGRHLERLSPR